MPCRPRTIATVLCLSACIALAQTGGAMCAAKAMVGRHLEGRDWHDLALRDGLAFVAGYQGLSVIDVSDPTSPHAISALELDQADEIALLEGFALVGGHNGLKTVNISDPTAPTLVASLELAFVSELELRDGLAYLAAGGQLLIVDVHDPAQPVPIGEIMVPDGAGGFALDGTTVFFAQTTGFAKIDVSTPSDPVLTDEFETESVHRIVLSEHLAIIGDAARSLVTFDVSDLAERQPLGSIELPFDITDILVHNGLVYVNAGRAVVDIADPAEPELLGSYPSGGDGAAAAGSFLYSATHRGLDIVDLRRDPTHPELSQTPTDYSQAIEIAGNIAFVVTADNNWPVLALDVSDPVSPQTLSEFHPGGSICDLAVEGPYLFTADASTSGGRFRVIDISNPSSPVVLNADSTTQFSGARIDAEGDIVVGHGGGEIWIADVSDPANPVELARHLGGGHRLYHGGVHVTSGHAYVTGRLPTGEYALSIFDLNRPADPATGVLVLDYAYDLKVDAPRGIAYVTDPRNTNLTLVDVRDTNAPAVLSQIDISTLGVALGPNNTVIAGFNDLWMIDASDPANPVLMASIEGQLSGGHTFMDGAVGGNTLFAVRDSVLSVVDLSDCPLCPADFNEDGTADSRDAVALLSAWSAQQGTDCTDGCTADINQDGVVNTQDVLDFLNLWAAGC